MSQPQAQSGQANNPSKTAKQKERNRLRQQRRRRNKSEARHQNDHQNHDRDRNGATNDQARAPSAQQHPPQQHSKRLPTKKSTRISHGNNQRNFKRGRSNPMNIANSSEAHEDQVASPLRRLKVDSAEPSSETDHNQQCTHQRRQCLQWPCNPNANPYVPLAEETAMVQLLFDRNGKRERGMLKDKPDFVVRKFIKRTSMTIPGMCSLRRHHIKLNHPNKQMPQLGLGAIANINQSAKLFEEAIQQYLTSQNVAFQTEQELKKQQQKEHGRVVATPDFTFEKAIALQHGATTTHIHWLEVKMYYGASTIPHGGAGAVGTLLVTAQKYVGHFGPGAIVFLMGCGDKLAADLQQVGVTCLVVDKVGAQHIDLQAVHAHQRTWCANDKGEILP